MEVLQIVMGCYGTLQSIEGRYRALQKRCGSVTGCCEVLWNITEHCVTLQDVMERYG